MKLSTEQILEKLKENPNYITRVRSELKKDINFGKLAVLINPKFYSNLSEKVQNNDEVVQIILDNAKYGSTLPSYIITQDEAQKEQLMNIRKSKRYLDLYINISNSYDENFDDINLNLLLQNKAFFKQMDILLKSLVSSNQLEFVKLQFGLVDGIPKTADEISKICNISKKVINDSMNMTLMILQENYSKKYINEITLKLKNR